jgi:hypothetical protein
VVKAAETWSLSPTFIAGVRNTWRCMSSPPYAFMAWCLIKQDDFTFLEPYVGFINYTELKIK